MNYGSKGNRLPTQDTVVHIEATIQHHPTEEKEPVKKDLAKIVIDHAKNNRTKTRSKESAIVKNPREKLIYYVSADKRIRRRKYEEREQ